VEGGIVDSSSTTYLHNKVTQARRCSGGATAACALQCLQPWLPKMHGNAPGAAPPSMSHRESAYGGANPSPAMLLPADDRVCETKAASNGGAPRSLRLGPCARRTESNTT
jgi:hypothetical protein